ncbi:uncharacterized protein LOC129910801 isoform X2 [Episyrphus balteatus]|uniref:uncharacterized protein LOC129910801 isoform X2 n=1 Tax=Episyrphus balteatus TaxID=286459 RepID=UPI0024854E8B|nr:uncharacterized protein LOC129910801 isoform X2 [Episyrphus balteatus]
MISTDDYSEITIKEETFNDGTHISLEYYEHQNPTFYASLAEEVKTEIDENYVVNEADDESMDEQNEPAQQSDPSLWKKNNKHLKRDRSKEPEDDGKLLDSQQLPPAACRDKDKHTSCASISEEERKWIHKKFAEQNSYELRKQYITDHVTKCDKRRTTRRLASSRRSYTYFYTLTTSSNIKINVCREFFMTTTNAPDHMIRKTKYKTLEEKHQKDEKTQRRRVYWKRW